MPGIKLKHWLAYKKSRTTFFIILAALILIAIILLFWIRIFNAPPKSGQTTTIENEIPYRNDYIKAVNLLLSHPDSALSIAREKLKQAEKEGISEELIPYYNIMGIYYRNQAMYDKSIETFYAYLEYAMKYNKQQYIAEAYENIGAVNFLTYRYKDALGMFLKSLDIYREVGDELKIAWVYNSVGRVYFEIGDVEKARNYYQQANEIFNRENFHLGISSVSNHMAKYFLEINQPDSALICIDNALNHAEATNNNYGLCNIYLEKGNLFSKRGNFRDAIKNYLISDSIAEDLKFTPLNIYPKLALADAYTKQGKMEQAQTYLESANQLVKVHNSDKLLYKLNEVYSHFYENLGDNTKSFEYYKLATEDKTRMISQSETFQVYNIEIEQLSTRMEQQNMEMKKQALLLAQRKNTLVFIVVISVFLIGLLSLLYYFYLSRLRQQETEKMHRQELKYSNEKNQAVLEAELNERKRLASELHDGIGTQLSLAKLTLTNVMDRPDLALAKKEHLLRVTVVSIDDIIREVKNLSDTMTPHAIGAKGLKEAIKEMVAKFAQIRNYKIKLSIIGLTTELKPFASHAIYRTVQELLANALKHASGSEINIQLLQNEDDLTIMIEDDGKGFDTENPAIQKRFGLKNAKSRVDSLNGQLLIDSVFGRGTIITITIPLKDLNLSLQHTNSTLHEKNKSLYH
ncbi:MAG: tetratricopeptide repeat protein [Bacteroidales bacterium]|nr:tetratricopeptide repeat protein [Bacteroidales bacterium]